MAMQQANRRCRPARSGNVVVLTVFLMMAMFGMLSFSIDLGYLYTARTQMQRSADSAALAGTCRLLEDQIATLGEVSALEAALNARNEAEQFASLNPICLRSPELADGDVLIGSYTTDDSGQPEIGQEPSLSFNTVRVRVQRSAVVNGEVPLMFARVLGIDQTGLSCEATAVFWSSFRGFQTPSDGSNLGILPLALDEDTWQDGILNGNGTDQYTWDEVTGTVTAGPDGVPEVNLYPQGTGSPGNRGTVDIGSSNNSTQDLKRQILDGISPADLEHHGGRLELDVNGELQLNADTGISAAIKAELNEIKGQPRVIPIFETVAGNGNNANYTITSFAGVRIMNVALTGAMKSKNVMIQPAAMRLRGGIKSTSGTPESHFIYSPVVLIQ